MKRQAAYHGEIGANGKAYQKGQFIAEQAENSTASATKHNRGKVRKQEIAPYIWDAPEDNEMRSIYSDIAGTVYNIHTDEINLNDYLINQQGWTMAKAESLVARYKAGERWYYPNHEIYI